MKTLILIISCLSIINCALFPRLPLTRELYEPEISADGRQATYECMHLKESVSINHSWTITIYPPQNLKLHATTSVYRYYIAETNYIEGKDPIGIVYTNGSGFAIHTKSKQISFWVNTYGILGQLPILAIHNIQNVKYENSLNTVENKLIISINADTFV